MDWWMNKVSHTEDTVRDGEKGTLISPGAGGLENMTVSDISQMQAAHWAPPVKWEPLLHTPRPTKLNISYLCVNGLRLIAQHKPAVASLIGHCSFTIQSVSLDTSFGHADHCGLDIRYGFYPLGFILQLCLFLKRRNLSFYKWSLWKIIRVGPFD